MLLILCLVKSGKGGRRSGEEEDNWSV